MRLARSIPVLVLALVLWHQPATAQETPSDTLLTVDHYLDLERVGGAQISPDGSQIIYTRSRVDKIADRWTSELWIMNADGSKRCAAASLPLNSPIELSLRLSIHSRRPLTSIARCCGPSLSNDDVVMTTSAPTRRYFTTSSYVHTPEVAASDASSRPVRSDIHIIGSRIS